MYQCKMYLECRSKWKSCHTNYKITGVIWLFSILSSFLDIVLSWKTIIRFSWEEYLKILLLYIIYSYKIFFSWKLMKKHEINNSQFFYTIFQYYDNDMHTLYFLMQYLPICYIGSTDPDIWNTEALTPLDPVLQKGGGSADPADPVVPTPLERCLQIETNLWY